MRDDTNVQVKRTTPRSAQAESTTNPRSHRRAQTGSEINHASGRPPSGMALDPAPNLQDEPADTTGYLLPPLSYEAEKPPLSPKTYLVVV